MTTPEQITVSLEVAKRLKAEGWGQDVSSHHWTYWEDTEDEEVNEWILWAGVTFETYVAEFDPVKELKDHLAAPTAEEILRGLPKKMDGAYLPMWLQILPDGDEWKVEYACHPELIDRMEVWKEADTLANAAAEMWIYLSTNNLL